MERTSDPQPVVCTLGAKPRAAQVLEWHDVSSAALSAEAVADGVVVVVPLGMADAVEDLADRERACCGTWLDIATERHARTLRVAITTANPDGLPMIREIAGLSNG